MIRDSKWFKVIKVILIVVGFILATVLIVVGVNAVNRNSIEEFMKDVNVWGEDLTLYKDFYLTVSSNVEKINKGISLI